MRTLFSLSVCRNVASRRDATKRCWLVGPLRRADLAAFLTVALLATAACGRTVGQTIDDTTITTRVKTAMLNDEQVGGLSVDVDTFKGVVTLSGRVRSQVEKDRAISIARTTSGVVEVKDALQIEP